MDLPLSEAKNHMPAADLEMFWDWQKKRSEVMKFQKLDFS